MNAAEALSGDTAASASGSWQLDDIKRLLHRFQKSCSGIYLSSKKTLPSYNRVIKKPFADNNMNEEFVRTAVT